MTWDIRRIVRRIFAIVRRGALIEWQEAKNPRIRLRGSHARTPVELFLPYGLSYQPPDDGEAVYFSEQGDEDLAYAVGVTGGNSRPPGKYPGHVILWCNKGQRIDFCEDGGIKITAEYVEINGIRWDTHRHSDVEPGAGVSGGPV